MFALHRQTRSLAKRFVFGIVVVFVLALTCGLASHTAKAQVRIGIGVGGMMAVFCWTIRIEGKKASKANNTNEAKAPTESKSTKKTTKAKNQKPKRDDSKIAKKSPPKAKSPEPVASAPQATPLTAGPPPTPDNFGE